MRRRILVALFLSLADVAAAAGGEVLAGPPERALAGVSIDSRTAGRDELFVAIKGPRFDGHHFLTAAAARGAGAAVVHRDVVAPSGLGLVRVADTTKALWDLARHVRGRAAAPVVAITGSAGKTTTKEMTATLLAARGSVLKTEGNLNNQYGLPLTLLRLRDEHKAVVLELGMSAPGELRELSLLARPDVAVITNVGAAHLEFFDSVDAIARAKAEILEGLAPGGRAVLNGDDPRLRRLAQSGRHSVVWFGRDRRYDVSAENWRGTAFGMRFDLRVGARAVDVALPLPGPHFMMNFLAAAAAGHVLGIEPEAMAEAATRMEAAPHRGRVLRLGEGVILLDDSYNSNPEALEAAVAALQTAPARRRVAFLGDMLELGPRSTELHRGAGEGLGGRVDVLVAVGARAEDVVEGARRAGVQGLHAFADSGAAAAAAPGLVQAGDAVLVKGSRGVHLEKVVDALVDHLGKVDG